MNNEGRWIADIRTGRQKGRVIESDRKRKLLAQNFQKAGILFIQKAPRHPHGGNSHNKQTKT